jgi:uncharacterized protein (DUF362 family)
MMPLSRRVLLGGLGAGVLRLGGQQVSAPAAEVRLPAVAPVNRRSRVSLLRGTSRRKLVHDALLAIDAELAPALKRKKYVLIKPNLTSVVNQVASTHLDALCGIMDYLAPRFKGPVVIAEAASAETPVGYDNFKYAQLLSEFRSRQITLIDLNQEARAVVVPLVDADLRPMPVRLAARLLDPDAFILCAAIPKTHDTVVATLAVKNMAQGAPLHSLKGEARWHDKAKIHTGIHQINYNLLLLAQKLAPFWGATVLDGFEGMEGNGPVSGPPVAHRIAMASMDYVAADRVGVEAMGINPKWIGYLQYCEQVGLGNYDIAKIDVLGETIAAVKKTYQLHRSTERQLRWMGPLAGAS